MVAKKKVVDCVLGIRILVLGEVLGVKDVFDSTCSAGFWTQTPMFLIYEKLLKIVVPQTPPVSQGLRQPWCFCDLTRHFEPVDFINFKNKYFMHYMYVYALYVLRNNYAPSMLKSLLDCYWCLELTLSTL